MQPFSSFTRERSKTCNMVIHYKYPYDQPNEGSRSINEQSDILDHLSRYNNDLHGSTKAASDKIASLHQKPQGEHLNLLNHYTKTYDEENYDDEFSGSKSLNHSLASHKGLTDHDRAIHQSILQHVRPAGHEFHLFSGVPHNFKKYTMSYGGTGNENGGRIYFPAHTSTSLDPHIASGFAFNHQPLFARHHGLHMLHIHVKPHNFVLPTRHFSEVPEEHEVIIPAGVTMKHNGTTVGSLRSNPLHVHHFTIE